MREDDRQPTPESPGGAGDEPPARQPDVVADLIAFLAMGDPPAEEVLECGASGLAGQLGDACIASLLSDDRRWLHPLGVADPEPEAAAALERLVKVRLRADRGFARQVLSTLRAVRLATTSPEVVGAGRPEMADFVGRFGVRSLIVAPMRSRGRPFGHVAVFRRRREPPLSAHDEALVQTVADLLAVGVGGARSAVTKLEATGSGAAGAPALSARERGVLALLARGHTNREIAEHLVLSVRTVEWHRARIQWKLGVTGRAALVVRARELGLVS